MNLGKLDSLSFDMGLSAEQDQVIPRKYATLGEFGTEAITGKKWVWLVVAAVGICWALGAFGKR